MLSNTLPVLDSDDYHEGVSESNFFMWRAIVALAHQHNLIDAPERIKLESYFENIHFSEPQKNVMLSDLDDKQSLEQMVAGITRPEDQAHFFQFARIVHWNEGDFIMQEQKIMNDFLERTIQEYNIANVGSALKVSQHAPVIQEIKEKNTLSDPNISIAKKVLNIFPDLGLQHVTNEATESEFYMWRALFAIAHADDVVSHEEMIFLNNAMATTHLSEEQRAVLKSDLEHKQCVDEMFERVTLREHRTQFFYLARMLCWCDGDFDQQEQDLFARLKTLHVKTVDLEAMIGHVALEFEDEVAEKVTVKTPPQKKKGFFARLFGRD